MWAAGESNETSKPVNLKGGVKQGGELTEEMGRTVTSYGAAFGEHVAGWVGDSRCVSGPRKLRSGSKGGR